VELLRIVEVGRDVAELTEHLRETRSAEPRLARRHRQQHQLAIAAELFRVDKDQLAKCLCFRKISRPGSKSVTYARYSIAKAKDARDAMCKTLYGKLFDWLIGVINKALSRGIGISNQGSAVSS